MAPLVQVVFLIDVNYFIQWNSKFKDNYEHWKVKLYLCCLRLLTEFGAQTDKENVRWAFKFYNSKKFKPDLSHKVFNDFTISSLKKFEEEINSTAERTKSEDIGTKPRSKYISNGQYETSKSPNINAAKKNNLEKSFNEDKQCQHSHSYILNKSLQEILLDYNWDRPDISSPVKNIKISNVGISNRSLRGRKVNKQLKVELSDNEDLNFVIVFTSVPKNIEDFSLFIGKKTGECTVTDIFKSLFDQATLQGFKVEKRLRFHLINVSDERICNTLRACLQTDLNKLQGGIHEIDNLVRDKEVKEADLFNKNIQNIFIDPSYKEGQTIKGIEIPLSSHQWWNKKKVSSRSRVPQPGPLLIWEDIDGVAFLKISLEILSIQGSSTRQWEDIQVKGVIRGNAMNLLGIGLPSSLLFVCHAPDTIFPVLLSTLSEQNLFMILQLDSGGLVGLAPWVGGVGCLVLFSCTQLISPLAKCKITSENLDAVVEKGLLLFITSAIKKVLKNAPEMPVRSQNSCYKRFQPQMIKTWYPVCETSSENLSAKPQKRSTTELAMFEKLQKKYRPQMPRPLSGSHLPPQALIDVTQPAAATAAPDVPSAISVRQSNLRSSKLNVSRAQKLVKNSKLVTAQMRVKEQQAEEQEQQAACERKTIEAQNRAKKSIAIVAKTMKCINNPQDKDELAQALIRLRDNVDSVADYDIGQSVDDLYSTAQSVVNLALMHIKTNSGPNFVERELRDVLSREVLLNAKQVSEKCEEKYQLRQYKLQSLLLLEILWVLGYSRPNCPTPNKRKSPRKKKDIGEEYIEEILKLLRIMSLKYDPATVGDFLKQIVVHNYQESLGEILVEIFEELNLPVPGSLAAYANYEDENISPVKPQLSVKSYASSGMSNGPNSSEAFGNNGGKESTKHPTRPLLKREPSNRQIVVPHVKRNLHRINTRKSVDEPKTKGSTSKRELKSVCRNLFDKHDKLKRSLTVACHTSNIEKTPLKGKRKYSEIKSPLITPRDRKKDKNMSTPTNKKAKILVPETPVHAIKTTMFTKHRLLKSTGSTLITESPDVKGGSKTSNVSRRTSLPLTRRTSFYSGGLSRNFERGKLQLRVSHIKGQLERRNSSSNMSSSDIGDASFIFSEIIQNNSRMELRSQEKDDVIASKDKDQFFCDGKPLKFGLDMVENVEPHRPSFGGRGVGTPQKKVTLNSPLKRVRRSLSLLTPVKDPKRISVSSNLQSNITLGKTSQTSNFIDSIVLSKSNSTVNGLSKNVTPNKLSKCTTRLLSKSITPSKSPGSTFNLLSRSITPNKSPRCTLSSISRSIIPLKSPRCTPNKLLEFTPKKSSTTVSSFKIPEYNSSRKSPRNKSPIKASDNLTPKKSSRNENQTKLDCLIARKSARFESPNKASENVTPRKSPRIAGPFISEISSPNKLFNISISPSLSTPKKLRSECTKDTSSKIISSKYSSVSKDNSVISPRFQRGSRMSSSVIFSENVSKSNQAENFSYSSTVERDNSNAQLSFDSDDSNSNCNFVGFDIEDEQEISSIMNSQVIEDNLTYCITPGKRVQFNFDSTPTKCSNISISKGSLTPKSILKTPHKSPNKTPIKVRGDEGTPARASVKRFLDNTPKRNFDSPKTEYFCKPSPFIFSPKSVFVSFTPPIQKENKMPSTIVNEIFKNSTPTQFDALLHSPITSIEREKRSVDKFSLVKKATNSHMKSHRKLQLPLNSPSKLKSPEKCNLNWELKEILNSPQKFLLDSCTEFEMVSPSKKSILQVKTDLVYHDKQDEKTISKVVEMSFQEKEKNIQELPADQIDLADEDKVRVLESDQIEHDENIRCIDENELNSKEVNENKNIVGIRTDLNTDDLYLVSSLVDDLNMNINQKIFEVGEEDNISQNLVSINRKIFHQDSDSGISVSNHLDHGEVNETKAYHINDSSIENNLNFSDVNDSEANHINDSTTENQINSSEISEFEDNHINNSKTKGHFNSSELNESKSHLNDSEIGLKQDINELIGFLASPCKISTNAVLMYEQNIESINSNTLLKFSNQCSGYKVEISTLKEKDVSKRIESDRNDQCVEKDISFTEIIEFEDEEQINSSKDSVCNTFTDFSNGLKEQVMKRTSDNADECEKIESHSRKFEQIVTDHKLDQDSLIIHSSDNEEEIEINEFQNISLSKFSNIGLHYSNLDLCNVIEAIEKNHTKTIGLQDRAIMETTKKDMKNVSFHGQVMETTNSNCLDAVDLNSIIMETVSADHTEETNDLELSPEIPLGINVCQLKKLQNKVGISSTKRKLVFLNENKSGCDENMDSFTDMENACKKRKLSSSNDFCSGLNVEIKSSVLKLQSEQPVVCTLYDNENSVIINNALPLPDKLNSHQDPHDNLDMKIPIINQSIVVPEDNKDTVGPILKSCPSISMIVVEKDFKNLQKNESSKLLTSTDEDVDPSEFTDKLDSIPVDCVSMSEKDNQENIDTNLSSSNDFCSGLNVVIKSSVLKLQSEQPVCTLFDNGNSVIINKALPLPDKFNSHQDPINNLDMKIPIINQSIVVTEDNKDTVGPILKSCPSISMIVVEKDFKNLQKNESSKLLTSTDEDVDPSEFTDKLDSIPVDCVSMPEKDNQENIDTNLSSSNDFCSGLNIEIKSSVLKLQSEQPVVCTLYDNENSVIINNALPLPDKLNSHQDPHDNLDMKIPIINQSIVTDDYKDTVDPILDSCSSISMIVVEKDCKNFQKNESSKLLTSIDEDVDPAEFTDKQDPIPVDCVSMSEKDNQENIDTNLSTPDQAPVIFEEFKGNLDPILNSIAIPKKKENNLDISMAANKNCHLASESRANARQSYPNNLESDNNYLDGNIIDEGKTDDSSFIDVETLSDDESINNMNRNSSCNSPLKESNNRRNRCSPVLLTSSSNQILLCNSPSKTTSSMNSHALRSNSPSTSQGISCNRSLNKTCSYMNIDNPLLLDSPSTSQSTSYNSPLKRTSRAKLNNSLLFNDPEGLSRNVLCNSTLKMTNSDINVKNPLLLNSQSTSQIISYNNNSPLKTTNSDINVNNPLLLDSPSTRQNISYNYSPLKTTNSDLNVNNPLLLGSPSTSQNILYNYSPLKTTNSDLNVNNQLLLDSPSTSQNISYNNNNSPLKSTNSEMNVNNSLLLDSPSTSQNISYNNNSPLKKTNSEMNVNNSLLLDSPSTSQNILCNGRLKRTFSDMNVNKQLLLDSPSKSRNLSYNKPLKRINSDMNINNRLLLTSPSPSRNAKMNSHVTPRRSNRKGKQTSFYESPINLEETNYSLFSPVFSSRKKAAKLKRTSRKLYDNQDEHFANCDDDLMDGTILPSIKEENFPLSPLKDFRPLSPVNKELPNVKGIFCESPVKAGLSDSFEVVSPLKIIKTFEKECGIPEEQKTPIVIRIRRKKKTPNPSPRRPARASKLKALKNIEQDLQDDDFDDFCPIEN